MTFAVLVLTLATGWVENPTIGGDLMISSRGYGFGGGLSLSQSLLSVFLIPAKRRVAKARLQHAIVTVGHATLELVRDVKVAYEGARKVLLSEGLKEGEQVVSQNGLLLSRELRIAQDNAQTGNAASEQGKK